MSCKQEQVKKSIQLQLPKENLEFHSFYLEFKRKNPSKIITKNSKAYKELNRYLSKLDGLRVTHKIDFHPSHTIVSDSFKLSINLYKLGIEYINKNNKHIKLMKHVHYNEIFSLRFVERFSEKAINHKKMINGLGKFNKEEFILCDSIPRTIDYHYKTGMWTFYNNKKELIAEGVFDNYTDLFYDIDGDCEFPVKYSKIDPYKWKFYNDKKELILPTLSLIHQLERIKRLK